jgi:hypothetical protein
MGQPEQGQKQLDPMAVAGEEKAVELDRLGRQAGSRVHNALLLTLGHDFDWKMSRRSVITIAC